MATNGKNRKLPSLVGGEETEELKSIISRRRNGRGFMALGRRARAASRSGLAGAWCRVRWGRMRARGRRAARLARSEQMQAGRGFGCLGARARLGSVDRCRARARAGERVAAGVLARSSLGARVRRSGTRGSGAAQAGRERAMRGEREWERERREERGREDRGSSRCARGSLRLGFGAWAPSGPAG
jgi:hypothetical protein